MAPSIGPKVLAKLIKPKSFPAVSDDGKTSMFKAPSTELYKPLPKAAITA